ncbi:centromere protein I isoform X2 [Ascaphus truei]|uniref:centromere protein I isoform X2 n=1 Tax=Ascaphus truei TaxID=8439 RepID=UPI003F59E4FD
MDGEQPRRSQRGGSQGALEEVSTQRLDEALQYFKSVDSKVKGNIVLLQHVCAVESFAQQWGVPADGIDILLSLALGGNLADSVSVRVLKSLVPASEVPQSAVIRAVSLFCVGRCSPNTQVMFLRWLITVFDLIKQKDQLRAVYNFFFCFLQDDRLCPYLCHLLYLLTQKENVKPFRVRKLLELQSKMGLQPHLLGLLSIYKIFCPGLVTLSLPARVKTYFKSSHVLWRLELRSVNKRNMGDPAASLQLRFGETGPPPQSRKRKWNSNTTLPLCSSLGDPAGSRGPITSNQILTDNQTFPVEKLHTFPQLLENIHRLELPAQMGSVLKSPLLLHYINCIKDDSPFLRLNFWLASTLQEECAWYNGNKRAKEEVETFLETVVNAQQFLQEGLSSCEEFVYRCLPHWNGSHRSQILQLVSWVPLASSTSEVEVLLYEPLAQLFVSSSVYFKCSIIESLKALLENWLLWHAVSAECVHTQGISMDDTMSGLLNSVGELIQFTGRLSTLGLQIQSSSLLLHFILDFYETVCDMYVRFGLPMVILPPAGVFYPALLSMDSVNLNQLCYIMYRYRKNLVAAKDKEKKGPMNLNISSQTFQEYNQYLTAMVGCLWTSQGFHQDTHPQGIQLQPHVLERTGVLTYKNSFNIVYHPALMGHATLFLRQASPSLIRGAQLHCEVALTCARNQLSGACWGGASENKKQRLPCEHSTPGFGPI